MSHPNNEHAARLREMAAGNRRWAIAYKYETDPISQIRLNSLDEGAAALLAGAEALERAVWRPMSEAHEDYGSIVLIDMADPGNHDIAHVCGRDWDEKTQGMTHFAQLPLLTEEIACAALARLEGK
jgi:hypothetical protein